MIPDEAMEAAHKAWREQAAQDGSIFEYNLRAAIEAAAPHMLSHEREETRLAHVDAVVNAATVDRLEREMREAIAEAWDAGEDAGQRNADSARGHDIEHTPNPYRTTK